MEFRLLGTIEVSADESSLPLGGPRQRAVIADLALHVGRPVTTAQLIDDVWGETAPRSATHTVETYISRIRRALAAAGGSAVLVTTPNGYMLDLAPETVDVCRFRDLAARGGDALERGDAAGAETLVRSALALWRGPAVADIQDAPFAPLAAHGLEDERLTALEKLTESRLRLGHHRELVPELETLIAESPYRECFHAQLMLALYRSGRQAEALAAFRRARDLLSDQLGLEPGPELRELERAILVHAPELGHVSGGAVERALRPLAAGPPLERVKHRNRPRRTRLWAAVAATAVGVALAIGVAVLRSDQTHATELSNSVGELGVNGGSIGHRLALPGPPGGAVSAHGSVWVTSPDDNAVYRIDPRTPSITDRIPVGAGPNAIAATGRDIWVANTLGDSVSRIDVANDRVIHTTPVGAEPTGIAVGGGAIWVADAVDSTLVQIDPASGRRIATISLASAPFGVAYGDGSVWVTSPADDSLVRVDPVTGRAGQAIQVGGGPTAVAFGRGSVWVANGLDSTVSQVDPRTDTVADTTPAGDGPDAIVIDGDAVWTADRLSSALTRIAQGGGGSPQTIRVGGGPVALASAGGELWFAAGAAPARPAGGTLRVLSHLAPGRLDPVALYPLMEPTFTDWTWDSLVTVAKTGGSDGVLLVPDLALAMPAVSGDGTTYTFTLRPRLRYSNGQPVRPQDFRYALERVFQLNSSAASEVRGIVGAAACRAAKPCDLDRGIQVDDSARTITFHLTAPDPEFLEKLTWGFAAPVPPSVPRGHASAHPVPGTGPYMVSSDIPGRKVVFSRNPNFHEWSQAAQPEGSPEHIVWRFGMPFRREAAAIAAGRDDWTNDPLPNVAGLAARFPGRVRANPTPSILYTAFNTRVPPFNDPRVRRAFSLAANRARLVAELGGAVAAEPTCQILPPGVPGYRPYCPFTTDPSARGVWVGTDLRAARQLVKASGTRGMRVTLWSLPGDNQRSFITSVLRKLGYVTRVHVARLGALFAAVNNSRRRIQATDGEYDSTAPSDFFDTFFRCSAWKLDDPAATRNGSFFCDRAADRLMKRADREETSDPAAAAATWASVDRAVTYAAPWVPFVNLNNVDFLSSRVSNYQYNPLLGVLLDQLRIRPKR